MNTRWLFAIFMIVVLSACGRGDREVREASGISPDERDTGLGDSFLDIFDDRDDPNITLAVNKYIWNASLEVLDFLPVETADPFSGLIVTGYGRPPGGGVAWRATIHISDPALDARSLNLALARRDGSSADTDTVLAVEDAILTRARQLRLRDERL